MARNPYSDQPSTPLPPAIDGEVPTVSGSPATFAAPAAQPPVTSDPGSATLLAAVEQQLTRYFTAIAARADAVQQAGEAGRVELVTHFQQQIDVLRAELQQANEARADHERTLQKALEDRFTDFAAAQHWRFGELEGRFERVTSDLGSDLPEQLATASAATAGVQDQLDQTTAAFTARIEELQQAARTHDQQNAAMVDHINESSAALVRRMDDSSRALGEHVELRTTAVAQHVDEGLGAMRNHVTQHLTTVAQRFEQSDNDAVARASEMEERLNAQTAERLGALEATIRRISTGMDEAIVALSQRVIGLEGEHNAAQARLDELTDAVAKVDEEAINQIREQMSAAIGESMLVRIELERVATNTGEQLDRINARVGELAAQIADTEMDVSTAIQLERLEELERALAELDPAQFIRKTDAPRLPDPSTTPATPISASPMSTAPPPPPITGSYDSNGSNGSNGIHLTNGTNGHATHAPESDLSSW